MSQNKEPMFFIQDARGAVGNCALWWGPNGSGYTTELEKAGLYTYEEAKRRACRGSDIIWSEEEVMSVVVRHVRLEHLRNLEEEKKKLTSMSGIEMMPLQVKE